MEYFILGCNECPMCDACDMTPGFICRGIRNRLDNYIEEDEETGKPIDPIWCPLKEEHLSIHLKQPTV